MEVHIDCGFGSPYCPAVNSLTRISHGLAFCAEVISRTTGHLLAANPMAWDIPFERSLIIKSILKSTPAERITALESLQLTEGEANWLANTTDPVNLLIAISLYPQNATTWAEPQTPHTVIQTVLKQHGDESTVIWSLAIRTLAEICTPDQLGLLTHAAEAHPNQRDDTVLTAAIRRVNNRESAEANELSLFPPPVTQLRVHLWNKLLEGGPNRHDSIMAEYPGVFSENDMRVLAKYLMDLPQNGRELISLHHNWVRAWQFIKSDTEFIDALPQVERDTFLDYLYQRIASAIQTWVMRNNGRKVSGIEQKLDIQNFANLATFAFLGQYGQIRHIQPLTDLTQTLADSPLRTEAETTHQAIRERTQPQ